MKAAKGARRRRMQVWPLSRQRLARGRAVRALAALRPGPGRRAKAAPGLAGSLGQSSVEYALVVAGFLAMLLALAGVWQAAHEGGLQRLATQAASHAVGSTDGLRDIVLF